MSNNHLIIGLGGTGGNIIRSFRKTVYQSFGGDLAPNVNLRYLYVDSDKGMMEPNDPSWSILGHSVQLPVRSQLHISGLNLKDVVDNLNQYPNLKPWLGNRSDWTEILNSADASKIVAGQKRRLGRFLFAVSASRFREKITQLVPEMQHDNTRGFAPGVATTFHICCGLAGGTGSGTIVDAVSQVRATYPDPLYRIIIYAQLPERNPEGNRAGPNYHANGYAALMELNALSVGSWAPHDVLSSDGRRLDLQDPFNCCYLFSDENEADVSVSLRELPDIVSSFLFQKIVQGPNILWGNDGSIFTRQETFELGPQGKTAERSPRGVPLRTRAFFSFGVKQIAYPEAEIREFLTYSFAQQATRQLLFNNWDDGLGYKEEAGNHPFEGFVAEPKQQEHWKLDEQHLTLSRGILQAEIDNKSWKPISEFWKALIPNYVTHVLDQHKGEVIKMLPEFTNLCDTAYNEQYRGSGVRSFYEIKRRDMTDHVRELRLGIETDLFRSWSDGSRSMHDSERVVEALIKSLQSRLPSIDQSISKISEDSERFKLNETKIGDNRKEWSKLGVISIKFGTHKKILIAQSENLITRYTLKTQVEGLRFARDLVHRLIQELNELSADLGRCKAILLDVTRSFKRSMDSRISDAGDKDLGKQMVREYNPGATRDFVRMLSCDEAQQKKQTSKVRKRLLDLLGGRLNFANFAATVTGGVLESALAESCATSADSAHADAIALHPEKGRLLNVSIIELLRLKYDGNQDKFREYTSEIMKMSRSYLKLADSEKNKGGNSGIPSANNAENAICATFNTIVAPEAPEAASFRQRLCDSLKEASHHGITNVFTNNSRTQEITIVTVTNIFPARFVSLVAFLKAKYEGRIASNGERAFLELHSEGKSLDFAPGQQLYDLYPESYRSSDVLPWVMLAQGLDLIGPGKDFTTGRDGIYLKTVDSDGLPDNKFLGSDLPSVVETADPAVVEELKLGVQKLLDGDYLRVEKRKDIESKILTRIRSAADTLGVDAPLYRQQKDALANIRKTLQIGI